MTARFARPTRLLFVLAVALAGCAAAPARAQSPITEAEQAERETIVGALDAELQRGMKQLKFRDYEAPYYIGYVVKDRVDQTIGGKYGAIAVDDTTHTRTAYVEVRVGDYTFDNHANVDAESFRMSNYQADRSMPLEPNSAALRGTLWLLTDEAYKKAVSDFLTKKGAAVYSADSDAEVASFSKETPVTHRGPARRIEFDRTYWRKLIKDVTASMLKAPSLVDSSMEVTATRIVRYLTTSEGTSIVDEFTIYSIQVDAWARAADGMLLDNGRSFYARELSLLPDQPKIQGEVDQMLAELIALSKAPTIDPYTGPAILEAEASGVLFHEAVGHRLEGERQADEEEGRTFKGRVGQVVIPEFITVVDDPTLRMHGPAQLNGQYDFDDQGVPAQRAVLVEKGVLRGFLKSRTPIEGSPKSNGHGRAQGARQPMARMANTIVEAAPDKTVPYAKLKQMLLAEVKRQGKPFGLIIKDITGGSTNTSGYGYQAFKGSPRRIYKVDPETGAETLVRGAELVGTPLTSINKIVAASVETGVFNGYCGAESGYVPVSTVAPALLTTELELQRTQQTTERAPILPAPWGAKK